jgi:hypothetical protein
MKAVEEGKTSNVDVHVGPAGILDERLDDRIDSARTLN